MKNVFFHTIWYREKIESMAEEGYIDISVAKEMLQVMYRLEFELGLRKGGFSESEVNKLMDSINETVVLFE